jgi:anti-repressor protein
MVAPHDHGAAGAIIPILDRPVGDSINAVDARELHRVLESKQDFSTWFKARVEQLGLAAGVDFEKINDPASTNLGSANRIDYAVGLDAAKHIAMAERTEVGRRVRAYFIAAEKRSRDPLAALSDPNALRGLLLGYAEKVIALETKVAETAPKADVYDRIVATGDTVLFREAAKLIRAATGANENEVRGLMLARRWVQRLGGALAPASYGETHGYVTTRDREYVGNDGARHVRPELRVTQRGVARAIEVLLGHDTNAPGGEA